MNHSYVTRTALRSAAFASFALAATISAQTTGGTAPLPATNTQDVGTLPPELRSAPVPAEITETTIDPDGVEVITRTRRIERRAPVAPAYEAYGIAPAPAPYPNAAYSYAPNYAYGTPGQVVTRQQWLAECERRIAGRSDRERGGIIGGLLGAITGGIIGNRVADGDRLAGTLIGVGTGGLAGVLLGNLIGGGRDEEGEYDCEAALDAYLTQPAIPTQRIAARSITAPGTAAVYAPAPYAAAPYAYAPSSYAYAGAPYGYTYAPAQQVYYLPVQYQQPQRVVVREMVREETVPGARRVIPAPAPRPVYIKGSEPRPIKGN
ncbi:hypothetical protein [Erythrobacter sp.]|jgi:hypothetical protein|uniref:hypothetical protein n=1 Tax=Erythrobacter sp. TaxID=1042 RepID=UPI002EC60647|nr:hypothetical protein [Erythrobacter sp.]